MTTSLKSSHTPGPWRVETFPDVMRVRVFGRRHSDGGDYAPIVEFGDRSWLPTARLIAAAPEMLDALKLVAAQVRVEHVKSEPPFVQLWTKPRPEMFVIHVTGEEIAALRAAISKAEGGQQ